MDQLDVGVMICPANWIFFTKELQMVYDVQHMAPLSKSDHQMLKFNFNCYAKYTGTQHRFNYNRGDYEDARQG